LEQLHHAVTVLTIIHSHVEAYLRPVTGHVADDLDGAVRDNMKRTIRVTQSSATNPDLFHGAADARNANRVTYFKLVFHQDEKPVDHVFHQCLRAESDGQSGDARAGEQRFNIDVERVLQ